MPSKQHQEIERLREAARHARRLSDEHRRAHPRTEDDETPDETGDTLRRQAEQAASELDAAEAGKRADALAKRRAAAVADSEDMQSRLRAEAAARREQRRNA